MPRSYSDPLVLLPEVRSEADGSAVAQPDGVKFRAPSLILGVYFRSELSTTATFHCRHSMKVNSLQAPEVNVGSARANFGPQRVHSRLERVHRRPERDHSKTKWAKASYNI